MSTQLSADTMKGHGLSKATVVDFYGLGKDGVPSEQPTRCMVGRVGNSYMLTSMTREIHTWEFGAATKVYAAKVEPVEAPMTREARMDALAPKAEVVRVDAVEVNGAKVENIKFLGMVPESLTADPTNRLAFGDYNLYVRWTDQKVSVDRSDNDREIVANGTRAGKLVAFREVMISLATFYGVPVIVAADPGVKVGAQLSKMLGTYLPRDVKPTVAPAYQACDTAMVAGEPMWIIGRTQDAQGWLYEVRELGGDADSERFDVRESEMSPYVLTPRVDMVTATPVEPVTLPLNTYVEITEGDAAGWTYSVTRFDEFWVGLRKVGTFRDGRNIRTDSFRAGLADGSVKVVEIVPTPTVEDVAAMTGDPVGWVNGLMAEQPFTTPTNTPVIDGYYWKRHTQPGEHITALSTYQLVQDGTSCQVAATVKYTKDGLWQANGCVWISTGLTPGTYWDGESQADAFAHVVQYMTWVASVRGSGLNWAEINRLDWRTPYVRTPEVGDTVYRERSGHQGRITHTLTCGDLMVEFADTPWRRVTLAALLAEGYEVIPAAEVAQGEAMALVTADGDAWHVLEREIWAGTDTMRQPMRTKVNKRKRNQAKRAKHSVKRGA